mmetsp:Transcript_5196/g.14694  ORF Transcript_5196/g.14694 Transcript_5196/m.14694 type:complete len:221 (-) Transcript_5196:454-1116(-)
MRQPPDRRFTGPSAISVVNPKPHRIRRTRASAASAPLASSSSPTALSRWQSCCNSSSPPAAAPVSSSASSFLSSSASSLSRALRPLSAASTSSTTAVSVAAASCCTSATVHRWGTGSRLAARCLSSVVFPPPLAPRRPYRRPLARVSDASSMSRLPPAEMVKHSSRRSTAPGSGSRAVGMDTEKPLSSSSSRATSSPSVSRSARAAAFFSSSSFASMCFA